MTGRITFQLFAKAPVAGMVKTRLFPALSAGDAARLSARMIEHAAATVRTACDALPGASGELWCAPDTSNAILRQIATRHRLTLRGQCDGDLGARMRNALESALPGMVVLLGSDVPSLVSDALISAVDALQAHDAVIVPSADGGYVLIGCRDRVPDCFDCMAWSSASVMDDTAARLDASGIRWKSLPVAWDVDTPDDLERLVADARFSHLVDGLKTARRVTGVNIVSHSV